MFVNAVSALRRLAALLKLLGLPAHSLHAQQQQRQRLKVRAQALLPPTAIPLPRTERVSLYRACVHAHHLSYPEPVRPVQVMDTLRPLCTHTQDCRNLCHCTPPLA